MASAIEDSCAYLAYCLEYTQIYNQLPLTLKTLPKVKFKKHIKIHIINNNEYHTIPNNDINEPDNSEW